MWLVSVVVFALWSSYKTRKLDDNFFIKREFRLIGYAAFFTFILFFLLAFLQDHESLGFRAGTFTSWFFLQAMVSALLVYPVWKCYLTRKVKIRDPGLQAVKSMSDSVSDSLSLMDLLTDQQHTSARSEFTEYLVSEFAVENILFFSKALEFEDLCETGGLSDEEIGERAADIYWQFVAEDSPAQVRTRTLISTCTRRHMKFPHINLSTLFAALPAVW